MLAGEIGAEGQREKVWGRSKDLPQTTAIPNLHLCGDRLGPNLPPIVEAGVRMGERMKKIGSAKDFAGQGRVVPLYNNMEIQAFGLSDLSCFVCSGQDYSILPFGYRFHKRELRGIKCSNCGLIFIYPQPNSDEINQMYDEDYFTTTDIHRRPVGRADYFQSVISDKITRSYSKRLELFSAYSRQGRLLEIGCGPGHFLNFARTAGWQVKGIELSEFAAQYARKEFGLDVTTGTLAGTDLKATFDVVFMRDLLEHLTNPLQELVSIRSLLSPTGIVFIEIPSVTNGLYSRMGMAVMGALGKVKYINLPPYHLFEFTPENVRTLFQRAGYRITYLKQSTVRPADVGLRDSKAINALKIGMQSMNYALNRLTGRWGDRLTVMAKAKD